MVVYNNFEEMFQDYERGLVPLCVLEETAKSLIYVCDLPIESFKTPESLLLREIIDIRKSLKDSDYSFEDSLGGLIHLCEHPEDLLEVKSSHLSWEADNENLMPNITVDLDLAFDDCGYVNRDINTNWAVFLFCTSNAGGPLYYIHRSLWKEGNVEKHISYNSF